MVEIRCICRKFACTLTDIFLYNVIIVSVDETHNNYIA